MEIKADFGREKQSAIRSKLGASKKIPEELRSGMEYSFRTDFSDVKLYESPIVGKSGAEAATSGREIAFAPGNMDFSTEKGKKMLGHELSHVVSQSKGEVHGSGVVNDPSLERQADLDGEKAASTLNTMQHTEK
ncbi:MAG: DUF4157 domain-containing protein [Butyrivibrio sp.]|nr:DUF4157 domain-containing protein [Butyrivibrio sp.]